jgi:hypothetical protein
MNGSINMTRFRITSLVLCCWLMTACSSTFLYNQLDWLIPWYLDDYVDLTRDQNTRFKARLEPLLHWHRSEELASYRPILDRIEADLDGQLTLEVIAGWAAELESAYERLEARWLPLALELGEELSEEQVEEFRTRLYKQQDKYEKKYLERSDEDYAEESYDNLADNIGDLIGRLSADQRLGLREAASQLRRFDTAWLEQRRRWLDTLSDILRREPGWQQAVRDALANRDAQRGEAYTEAYQYNQSVIFDAVAATLNGRTPKQDERLRRELQSFRKDIDTLISDAK